MWGKIRADQDVLIDRLLALNADGSAEMHTALPREGSVIVQNWILYKQRIPERVAFAKAFPRL